MKTHHKLIIAFSIFLNLFSISISAQNRKVNLKENLPFSEVLQMAKAENKLIFLDFGSITCKPCLYIKQKVLTLDSVADFINARFVSVDYNTGEEKKRLQNVYHVVGEPVLLILDQEGKLMHRMYGKMEGDELMDRFRRGIDPKRNSIAMDARYESGDRTTDFILDYMEVLHNAGEVQKMNHVSKDFLAGPLENLKKPEVFPIFFKYVEDPAGREMLYMMDNRAEFIKLYGEGKIEGKINKLYGMSSIKYLYGHSNPLEDSTYNSLLAYLSKSDHPKASEWLCYLVPAQYKFKDWSKMGDEINAIYRYNILKGRSGSIFKDMMITQYQMYCSDPKALPQAIQWCKDLQVGADQKTVDQYNKTIDAIKEKIKKGPAIEDTLDWQ